MCHNSFYKVAKVLNKCLHISITLLQKSLDTISHINDRNSYLVISYTKELIL